MPNVTTSITLDLWNLAKEKHLKWSECLETGIRAMANAHLPMLQGETVEKEGEILKKQRQAEAMQETIFKLEDEIKKIRNNENS